MEYGIDEKYIPYFSRVELFLLRRDSVSGDIAFIQVLFISESQRSTVSSFVSSSVTETATSLISSLTTTVKTNPTVSDAKTTLTAKTTDTETVLYSSTSLVETATTITFPYGTSSHSASPTISVSPSSAVTASSSGTPSRTTPVSAEDPQSDTYKTTVNVASPTELSSSITPSGTLSICPSHIVNPTYTAPTPLPTNYTWGCPPGYLCHPKKSSVDGECNFEAGLPADTYYCSPDECIPVPPLHPPQYPTSNKTEKYIVSPGYFNLNPTEFGLDYSIFTFANGSNVENGREEQRRGQHREKKRQFDSSVIPGLCFDQCNNCMVEAQQTGKTSLLCQSDSQFKIQLHLCNACIKSHWDAIIAIGGIIPQFSQFLDYCGNTPSQPEPQSEPDHSTRSTSKPATATSSSKGVTVSMDTSRTESPSTPSMVETTETRIEPTTSPKAHSTTDYGLSTVSTESSNGAITTTSSAESSISFSSSADSTHTALSAAGATSTQAPITDSASVSSYSLSSSDSLSPLSVTNAETVSSRHSTTSENQPAISTSTSQPSPGDRTGSASTNAGHTSHAMTEKGTEQASPTSGTGTGTGELPEPGTDTTVSRTGPSAEAQASRGSSGSNAVSSNISRTSPAVPNNGEAGEQQSTSTTATGLTAPSGLQAASGEFPKSSVMRGSLSMPPNEETPGIHPTATASAIAITTAAGSGSGLRHGASYSIPNSKTPSPIGIPPTPSPSLFVGRANPTTRSGNVTWLLVALCGFIIHW
ncbi:hypothetical protein MGYG_07270 [Paecilomyces variotii No. 5]|uniref:Glycoprotein X n=1 Tax=Byssochlamys spectabilis (strain No. 5 / NBRC 109023) TaxID=1356009 RepID=V5G738_BYSSN|nr:hypothetical protein MGYG_07270 [Paecilomyces variotii No. 5]